MYSLIQWIFGYRRRKDAVAMAEFRKHMLTVIREVHGLSAENRDLKERNARLLEILESEPWNDGFADLEEELEEKIREIAAIRDTNETYRQLQKARLEASRAADRLEEYRDRLCSLLNLIPSLVGHKKVDAFAPFLAAVHLLREDQKQYRDFLLPEHTLTNTKGFERGVPVNEF